MNAELAHSAQVSIDELLQKLTDLDSRLSSILPRPDQASHVHSLRQKIDASFEKLSQLSESDTAEKEALTQEISHLKGEIHSLEIQPPPAHAAATSEVVDLDQLSDMSQISAHGTYRIPNGHGKPAQVRFTEGVIKELNSKRVNERVRETLFQALLNGIVPASGLRGVKLMKTLEKIPFVEVKTIGGTAGNYRIYGCIDHGEILLHFLGEHMKSHNDPQRLRLKSLCK
jgi:hypothetical protein